MPADPLRGERLPAPEPAALLAELSFGARRMDTIGTELGGAIIRREVLEQDVKREVLIARAKVYHELRGEANRLERKSIPGEDVREALVAEKLSEEVRAKEAELAGLEGRIEALKEFRRACSDAISARQSVLRSLEDEVSAGSRDGGGRRPQAEREREVAVDRDTGEVVEEDPIPF